MTARHPKISTLNKAAEGVGTLSDGKKDVISNATRFVYAIPDSVETMCTSSLQINNITPRDVWYVGGITDETARDVTVKLDFLKPGVKYEAIIYTDGPDACGFAGDCFDEKEMAEGHYPTGVTYLWHQKYYAAMQLD